MNFKCKKEDLIIGLNKSVSKLLSLNNNLSRFHFNQLNWFILLYRKSVYFAILFFNNKLSCFGLEWNKNNKEEAPVEVVEKVTEDITITE